MAGKQISCMASGDTGPQFKFFFFAKVCCGACGGFVVEHSLTGCAWGQDAAGLLYLMETVVDKASSSASNVVKCDAGGNAEAFLSVVRGVFSSL